MNFSTVVQKLKKKSSGVAFIYKIWYLWCSLHFSILKYIMESVYEVTPLTRKNFLHCKKKEEVQVMYEALSQDHCDDGHNGHKVSF